MTQVLVKGRKGFVSLDDAAVATNFAGDDHIMHRILPLEFLALEAQ